MEPSPLRSGTSVTHRGDPHSPHRVPPSCCFSGDATIERVEELTSAAARKGAQLVVFPEVFVPGTPIWIDTRPIWDGDDSWFAMLMDNTVVIPGPAADRLAAIAEKNGVWLVVGVQE